MEKNSKIFLGILTFIFFIAAVSAVFYSEPFTNNLDINNYNISNADKISSNSIETNTLYATNIFGNPSWCYQETANATSTCGGLSTGVYSEPSASEWLNFPNFYDGNWSSAVTYNGTNGTIGYINFNYTKPSGSTSESLLTIKRASAINNYSLGANCWEQDGTKIVLRAVVKNLSNSQGYNFWQCFNGSNYINVTAEQSGNKLYEEAVVWKYRNNTVINASMDWNNLQNYPLSCPGSSAVTTINDSVVCSDLWVDAAGDTMTGNLNLSGNANFTGNQIYGELYNYSTNSTAWNFDTPSSGVYYNLTNLSSSIVNGFSQVANNQASGGSYLTALVSGKYLLNGAFSVEGTGNNQLYSFTLSKNHLSDNSRNCYARRYVSLQSVVGSTIVSCIVDLEVGDTIVPQIENEAGTSGVKIHAININALRVGN